MNIVGILRWFCGTIDFTIEGKFPERFLNLAVRNGVQLWNMQGQDGVLSASSKAVNEGLINRLAEKSGTVVTEISEHGFPVIARKYRHRLGLLAGLIIGSIFCVYLSGFIWTIEIKAPDGVNESEIRKELRELGFYEGVRYSYESVDIIKRELMLSDKRLSWVTINNFGTNIVIEMSMKAEKEQKETKEKNAVSNMLAAKDGIITKVNVRKGEARVQRGVGVRSGQLLISGIYETGDGKNELTDCEGEVFAKTDRKVIFTLPKKSGKILTSEETTHKRELSVLGVPIPVTLSTIPDGDCFCRTRRYRAAINSHLLPVIISDEEWTTYHSESIVIGKSDAERILERRKELYELFLSSQKNIKILSGKAEFKENKENYSLTVIYETEEDIAKKSYIEIKEES